MPAVLFEPAGPNMGIPERYVDNVQRIVELVLSDLRQPDERWIVRHHEPRNSSDWDLAFTFGGKTASLTLTGAEADFNENLYAAVRELVRENWP